LSNTYFQFKQFRIEQAHCAMKVCTDACIQGAYTVARLKREKSQRDQKGRRILDIGTGTGLLALMLAQEVPGARIDAIEMDDMAYRQARENFENSSWTRFLRIFHGDIRTFHLHDQYDFIICNPPFYENDLKSGHLRKDQAKHGAALGYVELMKVIAKNLLRDGSFCVMLPPRQFEVFSKGIAEQGFYPQERLNVRHTTAHEVFRIIGYFKRTAQDLKTEELSIKDEGHEYTVAFKSLLQKYYLHL
jgi:tRNA1Val (adenine37-N6)-methyltransferase